MVHHVHPCEPLPGPSIASSLHLEIHRGLPVDDQADVGLINALSIRISGHHQIDLLRLKVLGIFGTRRALMRLGIDWLAILWINVGNIGQPTHKDSQVITPANQNKCIKISEPSKENESIESQDMSSQQWQVKSGAGVNQSEHFLDGSGENNKSWIWGTIPNIYRPQSNLRPLWGCYIGQVSKLIEALDAGGVSPSM